MHNHFYMDWRFISGKLLCIFNFKVYVYNPSWTKVYNKSCIIMHTWITYRERIHSSISGAGKLLINIELCIWALCLLSKTESISLPLLCTHVYAKQFIWSALTCIDCNLYVVIIRIINFMLVIIETTLFLHALKLHHIINMYSLSNVHLGDMPKSIFM